MHEDLLGYLLGALEPHEMRAIEELLRHDPAARDELARIEDALRPLEEAGGPEFPPPDLVSRTLAQIPPLEIADASGPLTDATGTPRAGTSGKSARQKETADNLASLTPVHVQAEMRNNASWGWMDWFAGAVAATVLLGLLLPSMAEGRFEARKLACQNQLRELGLAINQFVDRNAQHKLPAVAPSGPEAFAGVYAVRLNDAGLLADESVRWCPSVGLPEPALAATAHDDPANSFKLVSVESLHDAPINELQTLQRFAGGHYAYSLGVLDGGQYGAPQYSGRTSFAVLSDAPLGGSRDYDRMIDQIGHAGRGINVLYEDGHVRFLPVDSLDALPDHPLLNNRGDVEAGVNIDDSVLAPSWRPPFLSVRQR